MAYLCSETVRLCALMDLGSGECASDQRSCELDELQYNLDHEAFARRPFGKDSDSEAQIPIRSDIGEMGRWSVINLQPTF